MPGFFIYRLQILTNLDRVFPQQLHPARIGMREKDLPVATWEVETASIVSSGVYVGWRSAPS